MISRAFWDIKTSKSHIPPQHDLYSVNIYLNHFKRSIFLLKWTALALLNHILFFVMLFNDSNGHHKSEVMAFLKGKSLECLRDLSVEDRCSAYLSWQLVALLCEMNGVSDCLIISFNVVHWYAHVGFRPTFACFTYLRLCSLHMNLFSTACYGQRYC